MAYKLYLDGVLFPVAPSKVTVKINNQNETVTLINEGEANILKAAGLSDVEFDLLLPNTEYPFALYPEKFRNAKFYLDKLEELKLQKKSFQYIMTRAFPNDKKLFHTNMTVSLEDYSIVDDVGEGFDTTVKIKLKQYLSQRPVPWIYRCQNHRRQCSRPERQAMHQAGGAIP